MESRAIIRDMIEGDCEIIAQAFGAQGWNKPVTQYRTYWQEHQAGQRTVLVAEQDGQFAGYVTIVWQSDYPPFREQGIPEIVDFNALIKYRHRGIGSALMDEAEKRIGFRSAIVGLGVGVTADYGAAQVLYVKRGYLPDGRGLFQHGKHLRHGETIVIDDHLAWYFTKRVR
jgi:ribosomal protein S18 acetylase RimI-like enzyme